MLSPEVLESQIRGELAVAELTIVSIADLVSALGEGSNIAGMLRWLSTAAPAGTAVACEPLQQHFVLSRGAKGQGLSGQG